MAELDRTKMRGSFQSLYGTVNYYGEDRFEIRLDDEMDLSFWCSVQLRREDFGSEIKVIQGNWRKPAPRRQIQGRICDALVLVRPDGDNSWVVRFTGSLLSPGTFSTAPIFSWAEVVVTKDDLEKAMQENDLEKAMQENDLEPA